MSTNRIKTGYFYWLIPNLPVRICLSFTVGHFCLGNVILISVLLIDVYIAGVTAWGYSKTHAKEPIKG